MTGAATGLVALIKRPARSALRVSGILPYLPRLHAVRPLPLSPKWDYPVQALSASGDPIAAMAASEALARLARQIEAAPFVAQSLLSPTSRALLYAVIRAIRPDHVVEIGTFLGGTAEVMARALHDNRHGTLHTVGPHLIEQISDNLARWPIQLRRRTVFYNCNSMSFFARAAEENLRPTLVLVDGNHDYEYAAFDISSAARIIAPGGFILVDNVSQYGPYRAAKEFLAANPGWQSCGSLKSTSAERAFDKERFAVLETDFMIIRAPAHWTIGSRPECLGEVPWDDRALRGLRLFPATPATGTIEVQCVVRAFASDETVELLREASMDCVDAEMIDIRFSEACNVDGDFIRWSIEPWVWWKGAGLLSLRSPPTPF